MCLRTRPCLSATMQCTSMCPFHHARNLFLHVGPDLYLYSYTFMLALHPFKAAQSSSFDTGFSSNHFNNVWYMTNIVPLCTLVHTPLGPTPLNQPLIPSVR